MIALSITCVEFLDWCKVLDNRVIVVWWILTPVERFHSLVEEYWHDVPNDAFSHSERVLISEERMGKCGNLLQLSEVRFFHFLIYLNYFPEF